MFLAISIDRWGSARSRLLASASLCPHAQIDQHQGFGLGQAEAAEFRHDVLYDGLGAGDGRNVGDRRCNVVLKLGIADVRLSLVMGHPATYIIPNDIVVVQIHGFVCADFGLFRPRRITAQELMHFCRGEQCCLRIEHLAAVSKLFGVRVGGHKAQTFISRDW